MNLPASRLGKESRWVRRGGAKKGCLIALAVFVLLAAGLGIWVASSWKAWAASTAAAITSGVLEDANLPTDQKDQIVNRVKAVGDDFKNGKISLDQLKLVMKEIAAGPVLPAAIVGAMHVQYVQKSTLPDEEKAAADRTLTRFTRGLIEKKITPADAERVMRLISTPRAGGGFKLKDAKEVTPEELRSALAAAKLKVDEAKIPDEDFTVDIAGELDRAVARALTGS